MSTSAEAAQIAQVAAVSDAKQHQKSPMKRKKVTGAKAAGKKVGGVADHPKYSEMVQQALKNLKERGGSSRQAILKYIVKNFNVGADESVVNTHVKMALKAGVKNSSLKQSKGSGASGSFRIGSEAKKPQAPKKTPLKAKKNAVKKATSSKKTTSTKKPSSDKTKRSAVSTSGGAAKKMKAEKKTKKSATAVKKPKPAVRSPVKKTKVTAVRKAPAIKSKKASKKSAPASSAKKA